MMVKRAADRFSSAELKVLRRLKTPAQVQDFINGLKTNFETSGETCMSPRQVFKTGAAHCVEAALLAAAAFELQGRRPWLMDLRTPKGDFDHVVAVFKDFDCYGAVSKTNHAVLRYREPVYRTLRELALSYFHEYFTDRGEKTLREYSGLLDLRRLDHLSWRTTAEDLWDVPYELDVAPHRRLLTAAQVKALRRADPIEIEAGKLMVERPPVKPVRKK